MARAFLEEAGMIEQDEPFAPKPDPANQARYEVEQILRKISFIDRCVNHDMSGEWDEAQINKNLRNVLSWKNEYTDEAANLYLRHNLIRSGCADA